MLDFTKNTTSAPKTDPAFDSRTATFQAPVKREVRSFKRELRAESAEGKTYLTGYSALYGTLSENLGGSNPWKERIMPGAFARAIAQRQDVRHLQNHDPNLVLGRTKANTLMLSEDATGLAYRTLLPNTSYAHDLAALVARGDVNEQSFAFIAKSEKWVKEEGIDVRELYDMDLADISTVTYPAYSGTSASVESRMFPDGVPDSVKEHMPKVEPKQKHNHKPKAGEDSGVCDCDCSACEMVGDCADCTNEECVDPNCDDCPMQMKAKAKAAAIAAAAAATSAGTTVPPVIAGVPPRAEFQIGADGMTLRESQLATGKLMQQHTLQLERPKAKVDEHNTLELYVYGDIGESWFSSGITTQGMKDEIAQAGAHDKIRVRINSFGGDAFEGIAINNLLKAQTKPIETCVDGLAASAASIIAMAGDKILMGSNTLMMIHNASSMAYGYASDLRKTADVLDTISGAVANTYVDKTGMSLTKIKELMDGETWMNAKDCIKDGFATGLTEDPEDETKAKAAARTSQVARTYRNLPTAFQTVSLEAEEDAEESERVKVRARAALALAL